MEKLSKSKYLSLKELTELRELLSAHNFKMLSVNNNFNSAPQVYDKNIVINTAIIQETYYKIYPEETDIKLTYTFVEWINGVNVSLTIDLIRNENLLYSLYVFDFDILKDIHKVNRISLDLKKYIYGKQHS